MLRILLCALIRHAFAVTEKGQIGLELPNARTPLSHQLPNDLEHRNKFEKNDSRSNITVIVRVHTTTPKLKQIVILQRQFHDVTKTPAKKAAAYLRSLATYWKHTHRNISSNHTANDVRPKFLNSFPEFQAEFSVTFFRKQMTTLIRKSRGVDWSNSADISNKTYYEIVNEFPIDFQHFLSATDESERGLLIAYAKKGIDRKYIEKHLETYNQAKLNERQMLRSLVKNFRGLEADEFVAKYKALRKGTAWAHVKLSKAFKPFFDTTSVLLSEYEAVKSDERSSIDIYLNATLHYLQETSDQMRNQRLFNVSQLEPTTTSPSNETINSASQNTRKWIIVASVIVGAIFAIVGIITVICCVSRSCITCCRNLNRNHNNRGNEQTPLRSMIRVSFFGAPTAKSNAAKSLKTTRSSQAVR